MKYYRFNSKKYGAEKYYYAIAKLDTRHNKWKYIKCNWDCNYKWRTYDRNIQEHFNKFYDEITEQEAFLDLL